MTIDPVILSIFGEAPDDVDLSKSLVVRYNIIAIIIFSLAVGFVALRVYVRVSRSFMWYDDYAIMVSVVLSSSTVITHILGGKHGAGEHVWATTIDRFIGLLKIVYSEPYIYALSVTSAKVSVLLLYRRLFTSKAGATKQFTYMFWFAAFLTGSYPPILWITMACACRPVSYYWNQYLGAKGSCINVELFFLVLGIVNMVNDIIILAVPIPSIWVLQMNKKTKLSVVGIMMLGGLVCLASIFRIYYLNGLFKNVDATWWMGPSMAWSSLEPMVAIISACLPTLAPLFRMSRNKESSAKNSGSAGNDQSKMMSSQNGRYALSSNNRSNGGRMRLNDDEVELTCTAERGDHATRLGTNSGNSDEDMEDGGIVVQTQVSVIATSKV